MMNFCTLFDSNYLTRGLAMYESLKAHCSNFHLYIFPFDDICYEILSKLDLEDVTLVSLKEFEDEKLLSIKSDRTRGEYCWTATSSTIFYVLTKFGLDHCTYLDADLYFYSSPEILLDEARDKSILITDHRYSDQYNRAYDCGKYCVQFVYFKNNQNGMNALKWWRDECIKWCYNRQEDGKFGDQKYLDDWPSRFNEVHELEHLGGGVAPWNVQQYNIIRGEENITIIDKKSQKSYPLVFYHFHELKFIERDIKVLLCGYELRKDVIETLYLPYIHHLLAIKKSLQMLDKNINPQEYPLIKRDFTYYLRTVKRFFIPVPNMIRIKNG